MQIQSLGWEDPLEKGMAQTQGTRPAHCVVGEAEPWAGSMGLEVRPSSIAPNPDESREAPPNSTVSLNSQRHLENLPEVTGSSPGNPGFPAATREKP